MMKISLTNTASTNIVIIILAMYVISYFCADGLLGGECVKKYGNRMYFVLLGVNLLFLLYYLIKLDKHKLGILLLNIVIVSVVYTICAILHSISKSGLF